jgi:hypothetical protein
MNMGLGQLGGSSLVFKRKYRWTLRIDRNCQGYIPEHFVKLAARPSLTVEETEINYLHGKMWIPGKGTWETITVTYYDIGLAGEGMTQLFSWLASVYDFTNPQTLYQASTAVGYGCQGTLMLYDGSGVPMEIWTLKNMWPTSVNFGELDYSSSEEATIELTLRYNEVKYEPKCGGGAISPCITGCSYQGPSNNSNSATGNTSDVAATSNGGRQIIV